MTDFLKNWLPVAGGFVIGIFAMSAFTSWQDDEAFALSTNSIVILASGIIGASLGAIFKMKAK